MEPLSTTLAFCVALTTGPIPTAETVVDAFVEAYNRHDLKAISELVSADAAMGYPGTPLTGRQVVEAYETIVFPRFPKVQVNVLNRLAVGDLVAQTERVFNVGPDPDTGLAVYRVDRGCIVSMSINQ